MHNIDPFYRKDSRILILGSFPSVKSRETGFFYGHPQNRFWKIIASLYGQEDPKDIREKKLLLERCGIALWDVIESCTIRVSSDASISDVRVNDVGMMLAKAPIERIFVNGKTAEKLYLKNLQEKLGRECICLPSSSPANAQHSLDDLIREWGALIRRDDQGE